MTEFILPATLHLFEPLNIILMLAGLTGGIIIGALPGLSATMGVALMVPATFAMNPTSGLIMLGAIYAGAIYGGANSAILICTPGTPSSVATTFDGWPLCQKGRADLGLYTSLLSSAFGGIVGTLFLLCLGGSLARFALQFGGPESFWLCLFGLSTIAVMTPDNMGKGIVSGAVGILVSTIGLDPNTGAPRFTFGTYDLLQGVSVIPCMIGLFSFSQVLYLIGTDKSFIAEYHPHKGAFGKVFRYLAAYCKTILVRSSVLGTWIGMLPGAGGEIASIISYNESKRWDKDPSRYGKGSLEGVAASESANNAVIGGSLIPMLTLGIPGSAVAAVILGALMAHGIQPGFKIFTASGDLAYTFIMSQFAVNLLMIPVGFVLCQCMARLLSIRLTLVFGETTELTGGEHLVKARCANDRVRSEFTAFFDRYAKVIDDHKTSDLSDSQPTKGNIEGGLTTIEEKALGNIQKIGTKAPVIGTLDKAVTPTGPGLWFMDSSSAAAEMITLVAAAGYVVHFFPTGQGNIIGNPIVPVIKLSANPRTIRTMSEHMDVDVSGILRREMNLDQAGDKLLDMMFQTIAGRMTAAEALKQNQFVMTRLYESA